MTRVWGAYLAAAGLVFLVASSASAVVVEEDPTVTEIPEGAGKLTFQVTNPSASTVDDIVGFLIELSAQPDSLGSPSGWSSLVLTSSADWTTSMGTDLLTWQQFFDGIAYPYSGGTYVAGFYLDYDTDGTDFSFATPSAAIAPGESESGFYALFSGGPTSVFVLSHVGDATQDFGSGDLSSFQGDAIPEPATMGLVVLGGLVLARRRR